MPDTMPTKRDYCIWLEAEDQLIRQHYATQGGKWCGRRLARAPNNVRQRAQKLGVRSMRMRRCINDEVANLHAQGLTVMQMAKQLEAPDYTVRAAHRRLNLMPHVLKPGDGLRAEIRRLHREGRTDKEMAVLLHRSWSSIRGHRLALHLKPNRKSD